MAKIVKYKGKSYTEEQIGHMREWIDDIQWEDLDGSDGLSDEEVLDAVQKHYNGGLSQFIEDVSDTVKELKEAQKINFFKQLVKEVISETKVTVDTPDFVDKEFAEKGLKLQDLFKRDFPRKSLSPETKEWIRVTLLPILRKAGTSED